MNTISIIVAIAENNAIGKGQQLLCHLPNDLKYFKQLTSEHTVVMGRKTFESLPKGALPNRKNVVLTTSREATFDNCIVCRSMTEALGQCKEDEQIFIIGGASVYREALEIADQMFITRIHQAFEGADTFFPPISYHEWKETERRDFPADEKHPYPYSFLTYERK